MSVSAITRKVCVTIIGIVFALSASITFASSPSSELVYIGAPSFYGEMDAGGYSDWIYWGSSSRHNVPDYHEVLSGEWGSVIYYGGINTEFIDPNTPSLGRKAMWLTDEFLFPDWSTDSSFEIFLADDSWDIQRQAMPSDAPRTRIKCKKSNFWHQHLAVTIAYYCGKSRKCPPAQYCVINNTFFSLTALLKKAKIRAS